MEPFKFHFRDKSKFCIITHKKPLESRDHAFLSLRFLHSVLNIFLSSAEWWLRATASSTTRITTLALP